VRVCGSCDRRAVWPEVPWLAAGGRHGSWYVRLELTAGLDGRRRRIRRGGYPCRKAALEVLGPAAGPASQ
jgi:hypothetical protein